MTVSVKMYGLAQQSFANKEIDWDSDTVKVLLCTSSYTPNQDTHRYRSDLTNEASGTGYSAGGVALSSKTVAYDTSSNTVTCDAADTTFSTVTLSAAYAVVYVDTGTSSTSPLVGYVDFGGTQSPSGQNIVLTWNAAGIVTFTTS